jgi:hypothetical protein
MDKDPRPRRGSVRRGGDIKATGLAGFQLCVKALGGWSRAAMAMGILCGCR